MDKVVWVHLFQGCDGNTNVVIDRAGLGTRFHGNVTYASAIRLSYVMTGHGFLRSGEFCPSLGGVGWSWRRKGGL